MEQKIFNVDKTDYEKVNLILGEQEIGLFDTVNKQFPDIWNLYKAQKSQDWSEDEFDYSTCNKDFKLCSRAEYDMMVKTLAFQWEADTLATRSIIGCLAPFITSSELWAAWLKVSEIEVLHSATYSEIVRCSFDNPKDVLDEVLSVKESIQRMTRIGSVMEQTFQTAHKYALGYLENSQPVYNDVMLFIVALYALERIQFMSSFAITFALADTGLFQPIGKAIQKIAQDEFEIHAQLDKIVLKHELKTERGRLFMEKMKGRVERLIDDVVVSEFEWVDYLFSEGRELVGVNADVLKKWVLYCAKDIYNSLDLHTEYVLPKTNPLKYMDNWLDTSKLQQSPQEEAMAVYRLNTLTRDDDGATFDIEF